jgi:hypothetical protein
MIDFAQLPPVETEQKEAEAVCDSCDASLQYTYRVEISSICSRCLQSLSLPTGAHASRNTNDVMEFVKPSPPGFRWDYNTRSHVPVAPADTRSRMTSQPPPVKLPTYSTAPQTAYRPATLGYRPGYGDSPADIYNYIKANYSVTDIRDRYSEIKDELLSQRGRPVLIAPAGSVTYSPENSGTVTITYSGDESDLTGREDPVILEDKQPEPKEGHVSEMETVFSRPEAEALLKRAAAAMAKITELEKKYSTDLPNGSVIAFRLSFSGTNVYSYAAVKAAGQWFTTGKIHGAHPAGVGVDWSVLLEAFEKFHCTDYQVLREGGDAAELEAGTSPIPNGGAMKGRLVELGPDAVINVLDNPEDEEMDERDPYGRD